ncbi:predicted protein [Aspergillus nidulans FGSC A4]|uniref:Uncharacterized protein n=1 Tax=Emericella nidulans (strain FGSC A4 / ATCC 38163 / CBS 112.46 / NRRL 194 / M139) TaxID=227321 RepID=Q5B6L4_EMENI|nr:hypothetical protein [Aspergillus nidulans FGSC A4]EAA60024.1 predicted protein [Aspergillus nidulans FGSC A4]CBF75322.1 TPA: conserved hypothetical protein [Aspergillus nidulans FGSC A4]|eukprot:XP_661420.1 predicted protein [Aspergillus nidulans FGSC A4]
MDLRESLHKMYLEAYQISRKLSAITTPYAEILPQRLVYSKRPDSTFGALSTPFEATAPHSLAPA